MTDPFFKPAIDLAERLSRPRPFEPWKATASDGLAVGAHTVKDALESFGLPSRLVQYIHFEYGATRCAAAEMTTEIDGRKFRVVVTEG